MSCFRLMAPLLAFACAALPARQARGQEFVPGRVLVRYRTPRALPAALRVGAIAVHGVRQLAPAVHVLEAMEPTAQATQALIARLRANPDVVYAEPDYIRHRYSLPIEPNDPMFRYQWALPMVHAPQAWSRSTGSAQVTVAVLDTGIREHPELDGRLAPGYDFIADAANGGDGNGRDADPTDEGTTSEDSSALHGTHVAGIIGAASNNGLGMAGVDWSCRIEPVRVLGVNRGTGVDSDIADAIRWAAGLHVDGVPDNPHPANVINMSFGGPGLSQTMQDAIIDAIDAGVTVVAAAGNDAGDAAGDSPAGLRGVIAVGAVDETGHKAPYSNFGPAVALMAPGGMLVHDSDGNSEGVLSTMSLPGEDYTYAYYAGTSQATPFVAGAVALMKAVYPAMTPAEARQLLGASADPSARCDDPAGSGSAACGAGLLDIDAAVALAGAQGQCTPACGTGLVCSAGRCVDVESALHPGSDIVGGCEIGLGSGPGGSGSGPFALFALGLLGLAVRRLRHV